jgi:serine/threonine-protein kinase
MSIIHRDMKPDNVLLGEEEGELLVRILDFGIAKHVDAPKGATDAGAQLGTPSYMSPEQLFHPTDVDHRSDLWSLGVMTYLCLTGSLPFNAESFGAICVAINEGTHPPASKLNPEIPRAMDAWFSKALAVPCEERFSSAKEMSDAYLLVLEGVGQLPLWAVRKDSVEGEPPSFAGGTGGVPVRASLSPGRQVPGSRRRAAALVVGGAMLVAAGFWSRDASLDRFVKAHVRTGWAPLVDGPPAEPAVDTTSVAAPNAVATELPSPAVIVPVAPVPVASATVAKPAPRQRTPSVAPVTPSVLTTTTMPGVPVVPPTAESETNPYSESVPPSAPSPRLSGSPHAPAL